MVLLTVKHATETQFLYNTTAKVEIVILKEEIRRIYNGRLKIERIANEMEQLSQFGTMLPDNMQGLFAKFKYFLIKIYRIWFLFK